MKENEGACFRSEKALRDRTKEHVWNMFRFWNQNVEIQKSESKADVENFWDTREFYYGLGIMILRIIVNFVRCDKQPCDYIRKCP